MRPLCGLLLVALLASGCASTGFSTSPPPRRGEPKLWVPSFTTSKLPNGVEVSVNSDPYLPMAAIAISVRGGSLLDPPEKAGLTRLLAEVMTNRAAGLSRPKLMEVYDSMGDGVHVEVTPDGIIFHMEVLQDRSGPAVAMLAHLLQNPDLAPDELERSRAIAQARLAAALSDPERVGLMGLRRIVFGPRHPAGVSVAGTARSLAAVTLEDLQARYRQIIRPDNIAIAVAGRVDADPVAKVVADRFGGWQAPAGPKPNVTVGPGPEPSDRKKIYYLPRPSLSQTVICVGSRGLPEPDHHYQLVRMIASRVPASAGSWLRGIEQVTYGVRSIDEASTQTGMYGAWLSVDARATGSALKSMLARYDAQPEGSFDHEKVMVLSEEGAPFFTLSGRARHAANLFVRGLPIDYFRQLRERLDDERGHELPALILEFLRSDRMQVVLVGDPEVIRSQVPSLGEGELEELRLD